MSSRSFQKTWGKFGGAGNSEWIKAIQSLKLAPHQRPAKLHFHKLGGFKENIWCIHLDGSDLYKASFTIDGDVAVMRRVGRHDEIDRNP